MQNPCSCHWLELTDFLSTSHSSRKDKEIWEISSLAAIWEPAGVCMRRPLKQWQSALWVQVASARLSVFSSLFQKKNKQKKTREVFQFSFYSLLLWFQSHGLFSPFTFTLFSRSFKINLIQFYWFIFVNFKGIRSTLQSFLWFKGFILYCKALFKKIHYNIWGIAKKFFYIEIRLAKNIRMPWKPQTSTYFINISSLWGRFKFFKNIPNEKVVGLIPASSCHMLMCP